MTKVLDIIKAPKAIKEHAETISEVAEDAKSFNIRKIIDDALEKIGQVNIIIQTYRV